MCLGNHYSDPSPCGIPRPIASGRAFRLIFYSADDKGSFMIDEHERVVHIKLHQYLFNVTYKPSIFITFTLKL